VKQKRRQGEGVAFFSPSRRGAQAKGATLTGGSPGRKKTIHGPENTSHMMAGTNGERDGSDFHERGER